MCRQLAVVNTQSFTVSDFSNLIGKCNDLWAGTQKDGFGYASVWPDKTVHGERFLSPFSYRYPGAVMLSLLEGRVSKRFKPHRAWSAIGSGFPKPGGPLVVHGRNATTKRVLASVHPFEKKGWFLTHNGVVEPMAYMNRWHTKTDCDTEHLLNCFALGDGFKDAIDLEGWAAFFLITPRTRRLWAVRDSTAPLYLSWIGREHGSYVLASEGDHIERVAKAIKRCCTSPIPVDPNRALEFYGPGREDFRIHKWEGLRERRSWTTNTSSQYGTAFGASTTAGCTTVYKPTVTPAATPAATTTATPAAPAVQQSLPLTTPSAEAAVDHGQWSE